MNVVFADDDPDFIVLFKDAFEQACSSVNGNLNTFQDGGSVLDFLSTIQQADTDLPHVIFLDINMPVLDGIATLKAIRNDAKWKNINVVILTSSTDANDKIHALQNGANDYHEKPVTFEKWVSIIKFALTGAEPDSNRS